MVCGAVWGVEANGLVHHGTRRFCCGRDLSIVCCFQHQYSQHDHYKDREDQQGYGAGLIGLRSV